MALGRLWVQEPSWAFLDESLSSVDTARSVRILARLKADYPSLSVCSIEHHHVDRAFYDTVLHWADLRKH